MSKLRQEMRIAIAFVFALLCTAPLASAQKAVDITPDYVVGIKLGMTHAQARALLGKPVRVDRLEDGYDRLVSVRKKVEAYFRVGAKGVVVVTTWSRILRTDKQVGPCSTVVALKKAYGARLHPFRQAGKAIAYRLGNLVFTTEDGKRVGAVGLGRGAAATYVALNAPECGQTIVRQHPTSYRITLARGGRVTIEIRPGQSLYVGPTRHSITTRSYGAGRGSFVVV